MLLSVTFLALLGQALCMPQEKPAGVQSQSPSIAIIAQTDEINPDGSFKYSYETANGIKVDQSGYLKDGADSTEKIQVIEGSVSYTDNDGQVISLKYIADENGFQPQGDHLPTDGRSLVAAAQVPSASSTQPKALPPAPSVIATSQPDAQTTSS